MIISILAAVDERGGIGRDNRLPWHPRKALLSAVARICPERAVFDCDEGRPQADEAFS